MVTAGRAASGPNHLLARTRDELERCGPDGRASSRRWPILGEAGSLAEAAMLAGLDDPLQAVDRPVAAGLLDHGVAVRATAA